ncbi:MAG: hypothetical protein DMF06_08730 [Verrucomicrobia bacterium]|nr:MAG: hypothetical protein DMF06_08730 [Verrucomicrobiota bacterium]
MRKIKAKPTFYPIPLDVATCVRIWEQLGTRLTEAAPLDANIFDAEPDPIREAEEQLYLFLTKRLAAAVCIVSITSTQE